MLDKDALSVFGSIDFKAVEPAEHVVALDKRFFHGSLLGYK